ncbi:hypothetical protein XELAEV_18008309mg [Xenopus laevis]|uniref:Uncharacterized protein n=1 Tax=Xenopus laevis TaxID=8355 RepID=A0A974E4G1_XENLA|nr:hypothetical protein XELAEV_18008309mg [Xenopus laevis]
MDRRFGFLCMLRGAEETGEVENAGLMQNFTEQSKSCTGRMSLQATTFGFCFTGATLVLAVFIVIWKVMHREGPLSPPRPAGLWKERGGKDALIVRWIGAGGERRSSGVGRGKRINDRQRLVGSLRSWNVIIFPSTIMSAKYFMSWLAHICRVLKANLGGEPFQNKEIIRLLSFVKIEIINGACLNTQGKNVS